LIVDESVPELNLVVVEGTLIFSDEADFTFDVHYLIIRMGEFIIGTEDSPYMHKLIITLHGHELESQLPEFGNKVIGCHHCRLDIHGAPRTPTWTEIASTVQPGAT
jgi:hypothetical protein